MQEIETVDIETVGCRSSCSEACVVVDCWFVGRVVVDVDIVDILCNWRGVHLRS